MLINIARKMMSFKSRRNLSLRVGTRYRTEDGRVYEVISQDYCGNWTAIIRKGISQFHPVLIVDAWGRNKFRQDLIEEIRK
jgi:hypothetical protein